MATIEEYKEELHLVEDQYAAFIGKTRDFVYDLIAADTKEDCERVIEEFNEWLYVY